MKFYYDVVCPYAYIASTQVEAVAAGAEVQWCPVLLGGVFRALGAPDDPNAELPAAKAAAGRLDILRQAARAGLPLSIPPGHPRRSVGAMRLILAAPAERRAAVSTRVFRAYWQEGRDIADPEVLAALERECGLPAGAHRDPAARRALYENTAALVAAGGFGVPSFQVGEQLFWGQDRLRFAGAALRAARDPEPLVFFHDFASPFSYLAATQVERVARAAGRRVEWVPILLGALFLQIGTPLVPVHSVSEAKRAWIHRDLAMWARHWGVPFTWSPHFPLNTVTALRVSLLEPAARPAIYRAAWVEGRNIADGAALAAVLDEAGFDGPALVAATADPVVKARLRANTDRARDRGVCGVPSFEVDGELFWGQDRLEQIAERI